MASHRAGWRLPRRKPTATRHPDGGPRLHRRQRRQRPCGPRVAARRRPETAPLHAATDRRSRPKLERSSRVSHAFAVRHSRFAVDGDTLSTHAASSMVIPPNARSSTILADPDPSSPGDRGLDRGQGLESPREPPARSLHPSRRDGVRRLACCAVRRRAWSTRIRRMTCAAAPKKCARFLPIDVALVDEPHIHLVHQGGGLECVATALASKLT